MTSQSVAFLDIPEAYTTKKRHKVYFYSLERSDFAGDFVRIHKLKKEYKMTFVLEIDSENFRTESYGLCSFEFELIDEAENFDPSHYYQMSYIDHNFHILGTSIPFRFNNVNLTNIGVLGTILNIRNAVKNYVDIKDQIHENKDSEIKRLKEIMRQLYDIVLEQQKSIDTNKTSPPKDLIPFSNKNSDHGMKMENKPPLETSKVNENNLVSGSKTSTKLDTYSRFWTEMNKLHCENFKTIKRHLKNIEYLLVEQTETKNRNGVSEGLGQSYVLSILDTLSVDISQISIDKDIKVRKMLSKMNIGPEYLKHSIRYSICPICTKKLEYDETVAFMHIDSHFKIKNAL
ncbi:hypothetical protein RF11_15211 [Thelohanellus kitauei]|uniref:C2H2-type domain-containing protein n=1 Tax=Thelohanellus kitauei TaxID=669202 RepID=A0A0C2NFC2_THEKT|nr:hypothetical protein RF11_15211 [Thelohanellus kitauei]